MNPQQPYNSVASRHLSRRARFSYRQVSVLALIIGLVGIFALALDSCDSRPMPAQSARLATPGYLASDGLTPPQQSQLLAPFHSRVLKEIAPGQVRSTVVNVNGRGFFLVQHSQVQPPHNVVCDLWKSDGTAASTTLVYTPLVYPVLLTNVDGMLYFYDAGNHTLWKSNGTAAGTEQIGPAWNSDLELSSLTDVDGMLFFTVTDRLSTSWLWKSDGTAQNTVNIDGPGGPGSPYMCIADAINVAGTLYFVELDPYGQIGWGLWKTTRGTATTPSASTLIYRGPAPCLAGNLANMNGTLFFTSWYGAGEYAGQSSLWKCTPDVGGNSNTPMIVQTGWGTGGPYGLTDVNGTLFFRAGANGKEVWKSGGTSDTTAMIFAEASSSAGAPRTTSPLANVNGTLFFDADDGVNGRELWKSNGTAETTVMVKDINVGPASSSPASLADVNGKLFFDARDTGGTGLWASNGTAEHTVRVPSPFPTSRPSAVGDRVFSWCSPSGQSQALCTLNTFFKAQYQSTESTLQGNWIGALGSQAVHLPNSPPSWPAWIEFSAVRNLLRVWSGATQDIRGLQRSSGLTGAPAGPGRIAADWYNPNKFFLGLSFTDGRMHRVAFYLLDWDHRGRAEAITAIDPFAWRALASHTESDFGNGKYVLFSVQTGAVFAFKKTAGPDAVLSGIFVDPGPERPLWPPPVGP